MARRKRFQPDSRRFLEWAAVLHDIGIRVSEESTIPILGLPADGGFVHCRETVAGVWGKKEIWERIDFLIAPHHEYEQRNGLDYQILVEADFLVNFFEEHISRDQIAHVRDTIFQAETGKRFVADLFLREPSRPFLFAQSLKNQA